MAAENLVVDSGISSAPAPIPFGVALRYWLKLGFINFGGPAGQIALMHRELVEERKWIDEHRFLQALNVCMLLPGPEAQQLATYIGWLLHGTRGGIIAGVAFVLPGFILVTAIAALYAAYHAYPPLQGVLFGLKAAVLAIVLEAMFRIGRRALQKRIDWLIAALAFIAIFAFAVPFPLIILCAALGGFLAHRSRGSQSVTADESVIVRRKARSTLLPVVVLIVLWIVPVIGSFALLGPDHVLTQESLFFSKNAIVTFGGAYAVLTYVAQEAVNHYHWLSAADMLQGLALAETTPGPLILVLTFVGYLGAFNHSGSFTPIAAGLLGALVTTWVTFVPSLLFIFLAAPHVERLQRQPALSAALAGVTAAVVGVILNLSLWFALHALFSDVETLRVAWLAVPAPNWPTLDWTALVLTALAAILLLRFKLPMLAVLAVCALGGVLIKAFV